MHSTDRVTGVEVDSEWQGKATSWRVGEVIVRRELIEGRSWLEYPQIVVHDSPDLLVAYTPPGAPF